MAKRTLPIRVIPLSFFLLAASGAWCQSHLSVELPGTIQLEGSTSAKAQSNESRVSKSLPDAPSSVRPAPPAKDLRAFCVEGTAAWPLGHSAVTPNSAANYRLSFVQGQSGPYRYSPALDQDRGYRVSTSGSLLGRAAGAASGIFVLRDVSGKRRLNTPFFLEVLSSVVIQSAYRPSEMRSASSTFNNFGSTLGSGAGRNVMQEFGPGIRQMVKEHTPNFVSRLKERITRDQTSGRFVPIPAR